MMIRSENKKIFDGVTIILIVILFALTAAILGMTYWKEKAVELDFKFFSQAKAPKESNQIVKGDRIVISFSGPIQTENFLNNLVIEPNLNFESSWLNNHQLQLIVRDNLVPDFNYRMKIEKFKSKWGFSNEEQEMIFSTDPLPILTNIYPAEDQTEMEAQTEISFEFEAPLANQYYLKIKTTPAFEFEDVKTENNKIVIKPVVDLAFDTEYQVTAELKSRNYFDFSRKIGEASFKTERPSTIVYGWNSEGVPTKTEDRLTLQEPSLTVGRYIDIDLSSQNLYIFENGQEIGAYKVSTGLKGMDTPTGEFKVMARSLRPWSATYGLYMPWFIQFTSQGHGIHELPEWPGGYKEGANHLGIPVSHGCVRLGIGPAEKVYTFVETGTPIVIHY
jgi:lipoprotein-anchoring transpeptidase ErfK/SrfK